MSSKSVHAGEVLWEGRPREVRIQPFLQLGGFLAYGLGIVFLAFGVVRGLALGDWAPVSLVLALFSVTLGAAIQGVPAWWRSGAVYRVTREEVIWQRGPFRRAIDRNSISYARIVWSPRLNHVGSLELVRAVPAGVLWRRLALKLEGLPSPDGVWAIIRGAEDVAAAGHGDLPVAQRLDRGERILWAARPLPTLRAYLPSSTNQWTLVALTFLVFGIGIFTAVRGVNIVSRLTSAGLPIGSVSFIALVTGMSLAIACVFGVAAVLFRDTLLQRARMLRETRYLISNKRVLIQRGREELHLDRRMIVEVIETKAGMGTQNLFLVLDGPRARALASNGAFGEKTDYAAELQPIFEWVVDGDGARDALSRRPPSLPPLPWAA